MGWVWQTSLFNSISCPTFVLSHQPHIKLTFARLPMISKFFYGVNPSAFVLKSALSESFFKILITSDYGKKQDRKGHNIAYIQ